MPDRDDDLRALAHLGAAGALDLDRVAAERLRRRARLALNAGAPPFVWSWPNLLLPAVLGGTIFVYLGWAVRFLSSMQ